MPDELRFDGRGLEHLARDLKAAARELRGAVDRTLIEVGGELAAKARALAGEHSRTIPATVRMRALPGRVVITAGGEQAPTAVLFELGNKGSSRTAGQFRHPVFGHRDVIVSQDKHPFLRPALASSRQSITRRMEGAWDRALEPHRLRPEG